MAERFDLIVFDWDGTLMDSAGAIVRAMQAAVRDLGLADLPEERARYVIGLGLGDALRHAVPDLEASAYPRMIERYRHHYLSSDHELSLFDGVAAMIDALAARGHMLAVATGKSRVGLDRALWHSGLSDAKRRQSIPDSWLIKLYQVYNLNPTWILDGKLLWRGIPSWDELREKIDGSR